MECEKGGEIMSDYGKPDRVCPYYTHTQTLTDPKSSNSGDTIYINLA